MPHKFPTRSAEYAWTFKAVSVAIVLLGFMLTRELQQAASAPLPGFPVFGQPVEIELSDASLNEVDASVRNEMASIQELLREEQWNEAIDGLIRLAETGEGKLILLQGNRYVSLAKHCHRVIGELPEEALDLYRRRVDPLAKQWYEQGIADHDSARLLKIVDGMYCSSYGDDALLALGELALERGEYVAARSYWEAISPLLRGPRGRPLWIAMRDIDLNLHWEKAKEILLDRPSAPVWISYPDTDLDLAEIRARLVWVSICERAFDRAKVELEVFTRLHPESKGKFAGRTVVLKDYLAESLREAKTWPEEINTPNWKTFAGSPRRTRNLPPAVAVAGLAWDSPIEFSVPGSEFSNSNVGSGFAGRRVGENSEHPLCYFPVVSDGKVFFCDQEKVYAYDLSTGKPTVGLDGVLYNSETAIRRYSNISSRFGLPRFTLTVDGQHLYARIGTQVTRQGSRTGIDGESVLVGLDLERGGYLLFEVKPESKDWAFEGAPISDGKNIFIAMRQSDVLPRAVVACFDAKTGEQKWKTPIASGSTPVPADTDQITHNLLTLVDGVLYVNTNLGVVAAVSAETGNIQWAARYDRTKQKDLNSRATHFQRDLTPCVYSDGLLFVAPSDTPLIFALDAVTGETIWESNLAEDVVQLLGVCQGNLIASGDSLWWFDMQSGRAEGRWPSLHGKRIHGLGRGAIAGDKIYWPTEEDKILIFPAIPKKKPSDPISPESTIDLKPWGISSGNLLAIDGVVLIATSDRLYALNQFSKERPAIKRSAEMHPSDMNAQFQFARCEEAMHNDANAMRYYEETIQLAKQSFESKETSASERSVASEMLNRASKRKTGVVLRVALEAIRAKNSALAREHYQKGFKQAATPRDRVSILFALADFEMKEESPVAAIEAWHRILGERELAKELIVVDENHAMSARKVAQEGIAHAKKIYGEGVYARWESKATELLTHGKKTLSPERLRQIAEVYPNAVASRSYLEKKNPYELSESERPRSYPPATMTKSFALPLRILAGQNSIETKGMPTKRSESSKMEQPSINYERLVPQGSSTMLRSEGRPHLVRQSLWINDLEYVQVGKEGEITLYNTERREIVWKRRAGFLPASQPDVVLANRALLLFDGLGDCVRIDPETGRTMWKKSVQIGPQILSRPRQAVDSDDKCVYFVSAGKLTALSLADGTLAWPVVDVREVSEERRLRWQVTCTGKYVIAQPLEFTELEGFRFVVVDVTSGEVLQRTDEIQADTGEAELTWFSDHAILKSGEKSWKLEWGRHSSQE